MSDSEQLSAKPGKGPLHRAGQDDRLARVTVDSGDPHSMQRLPSQLQAQIAEDDKKALRAVRKNDNVFSPYTPPQPLTGSKKYASYAIVMTGVVGNLFIIYVLDVEGMAHLITNNTYTAHETFKKSTLAATIGSLVGILGELPIILFQAGFGRAVLELSTDTLVISAVPGIASAMLNGANGWNTFNRLFGPEFALSPEGKALGAIIGTAATFAAGFGNIGFLKGLADPRSHHRLNLRYMGDTIALLAQSTRECKNAFAPPRDFNLVWTAKDGVMPREYGTVRRTTAKQTSQFALSQLTYLRRQLMFLKTLVATAVPDEALRKLMIALEPLSEYYEERTLLGSKESTHVSAEDFFNLEGIIAELGRLSRAYNDSASTTLAVMGAIPAHLAAVVLAYFGNIGFMPNAHDFMERLMSHFVDDTKTGRMDDFIGFIALLGWSINMLAQTLLIPHNIFNPFLRLLSAQNNILMRILFALPAFIFAAAVAFNMIGLIAHTKGVSTGAETLTLAVLANLSICRAIEKSFIKGPTPLDEVNKLIDNIIRSLDDMSELLDPTRYETINNRLVEIAERLLSAFSGKEMQAQQSYSSPSSPAEAGAGTGEDTWADTLSAAKQETKRYPRAPGSAVPNFFKRLTGSTYETRQVRAVEVISPLSVVPRR